MAVLAKTSSWALLDQFQYINKQYLRVEECLMVDGLSENTFSRYEIKNDLFAIYTPFVMESQAKAIIQRGSDSQKVRKRKRKLDHEEQPCEKKIFIKSVLLDIQKTGKDLQVFKPDHNALEKFQNNHTARSASMIPGFKDMFQKMCEEKKDMCVFPDNLNNSHIKKIAGPKETHSAHSFIGILGYTSFRDCATKVKVGGQICLIPDNVSFLTSDYHDLVYGGFKRLGESYDLILMDPPWQNKAVRRKKGYSMFDENELLKLPLPSLLKPGGLVCIWVTNKTHLLEYVKHTIFPEWGLHLEAQWVWLKMTRVGEPVNDIDSAHKHCYEFLIIGRRNEKTMDSTGISQNHQSNTPRTSDTNYLGQLQNTETSAEEYHEMNIIKTSVVEQLADTSRSKEELAIDEDSPQPVDNIPANFVLASIPCSIHSKKPDILEVIRPYIKKNPRCLELFARNLNSGWTSWGNEPLLHQHVDFFDKVSK